MKTSKKLIQEKAAQYGFAAMTNNELLESIGFKGNDEEFYNSYQFKAAKELLRRRETKELVKISSSKDAAKLLSFLEEEQTEQFWVIFTNRVNKVIASEFISKGDATGTVVSTQTIIKRCLDLNAQGVILSHNHPSGSIKPSEADKTITNRTKEALKLFSINFLDHVIITKNGYFSFADEGII